MHESDVQFGERLGENRRGFLGGLGAQLIRFLDQRAHPIRLPLLAARVANAHDHLIATVFRQCDRAHGRPTWRQRVDHRHVEIGIGRHRERSRDRRRSHDQLMGIAARGEALFPQQQALVHAEAVLLIDDHETQALKLDALLKQGVCADRNLRAAGREFAERANAARPRASASDQREIQIERREPRAEVARVLLREQFRRRHDCCLKAGLHSPDGGERGDDRLAATHVSLHEAQHRIGRPRSSSISAHARACALVNWKGRVSRNRCTSRAPGWNFHPGSR